jgi:hypothetical protein
MNSYENGQQQRRLSAGARRHISVYVYSGLFGALLAFLHCFLQIGI